LASDEDIISVMDAISQKGFFDPMRYFRYEITKRSR